MKYGEVRHYLFDVEMLRRRLLRPYFIDMGLTVGQGQPRILYELRKGGGMTQRELSDVCLIDVTTMSRTLDRLENMGLIIRESNPECRRSWMIKLTKEGEIKADKVSDLFNMAELYRRNVYTEKLSPERLYRTVLLCSSFSKNLKLIIYPVSLS